MFCWTGHLNGGPGGSSYAAVAVEHQVFCFGSGRGNYMNDVHVFNTVSLCWKKLTTVTPGKHNLDVPTKRDGQTAVLIEDMIYIWG